ncbi:DUF6893 family small protein [Streptomyces lydicus]
MLKFVLSGAAAAAFALILKTMLPDIKRYLRMRSM